MSPNRRGVGGGKNQLEKNIVVEKKVAKTRVAKKRVAKKRVAESANKTSLSVTSVRNLGNSPRVPGARVVEDEGKSLPTQRDERNTAPTHRRIMSLLSMAVVPEERGAFGQRFRTASRDEDRKNCCEFLCQTPVSVVAKAFGCEPFRLRSAADMFPESGLQSEFLNEFYIMDVILNRAPCSPAVSTGDGDADPDAVRHVCLSHEPEDLGPGRDYFYRAAILFLPQCGVFYCDRERHIGDAGVPGTLRAYPVSWLRLQRVEGANRGLPAYTFGSDSYVRRFYYESRGTLEPGGPNHRRQRRYLSDNCYVSAWRISTGHTGRCSLQNRVMYRAVQSPDSELPMLPPDVVDGVDYRTVPPDYRAHQFRNKLGTSNSAKLDCRHYVDASHHYDLPGSCFVIDADETHFVDVHVGVEGGESVVMVRNITKMDEHDDHLELLGRLTSWCQEVRQSANCTARAKSSDHGSMFALGTRIEINNSPDGPPVYSKIPYAANGCVADGVLPGLVADLAIVGSRCFPQVYSVIRDTEGNSGLSPVSPMDGVALPTQNGSDDNDSSDDDNDVDVDDGGVVEGHGVVNARVWANAQAALDRSHQDHVRKRLRKRIRKLECRRRVGYTVDMSVNLGNSSHFDVNDASQGYSLWLEEMLGRGKNWYFVMPNVHGVRPDGTEYRGLAVKLGHGVAISWDGRAIRHCTSVSCPDGMKSGYVTGGRDSQFQNHLYGVFTAAKEKIVKAGRAGCAASFRPRVSPPSSAKRLARRSGKTRRGGGARGVSLSQLPTVL